MAITVQREISAEELKLFLECARQVSNNAVVVSRKNNRQASQQSLRMREDVLNLLNEFGEQLKINNGPARNVLQRTVYIAFSDIRDRLELLEFFQKLRSRGHDSFDAILGKQKTDEIFEFFSELNKLAKKESISELERTEIRKGEKEDWCGESIY